MSVGTTVGFRWLDILEKEFDTSYTDLEKLARAFADDYDLFESAEVVRKLLANLGQCFSQLVHKAQTIFQSNVKLEAELLHLREELSISHASLSKVESEKKYLICCLQSTLIENHKLKEAKNGSAVDSTQDNQLLCENIQMRLAKEMSAIQKVDWDKKRLEEKCHILEDENLQLQKERVEIESELVGARLDAKYLDKELAGRIQQIQILLAMNTSHEHKQKVWSEIEASMHLQRSKTIANMCFSKQKLKESSSKKSPAHNTKNQTGDDKTAVNGGPHGEAASLSNKGVHTPRGKYKQVHFHKHDTEDLGMAILGGKEYGLPVMISEIFPDSAVSRCGKIRAGDILISVNGDSFSEMSHTDAVKYLSALRGSISFDLENTIEDDIDEVCDTSSHFYEFFESDPEVGSPKRNPSERIFLQHPGRAKPAEPKKPQVEKKLSKELPKVHTPRKVHEHDTSKD